jgi:hypothetical protein
MAEPTDKRIRPRRRTRLRSGKILDARNRFVIECLVHDRSADGARLRLMRPVPLPPRFRLYDDGDASLAAVEIVWRRGHDVGVRFREEAGPVALTRSERIALGAKFYAVRG